VTFTPEQQEKHRRAFIDECRQKAWSAACHTDFIAKSLDELLADYAKMKEADEKLAEEIKTLENALDSHSKDKRDKRKTLQERRTGLSKRMEFLLMSHQQGQQALASLNQNIETNLALAKHAETWGGKK
jgi:hypothetical protein